MKSSNTEEKDKEYPFSLRFVSSVFFCTISDADKEPKSAFQFEVQKVILINGRYQDSFPCSPPSHPNLFSPRLVIFASSLAPKSVH
jgi:hypothetical protein